MNAHAAPVHGLVLAGGASSRMHRDKAALLYQGQSQLDRAFDLLSRHVDRVFVSVRLDQVGEPTRAHRPLIVDSVEGGGPIAGIRSALADHPDTAWLVLACDLPFLSDATLERLLAARDTGALATAYSSAHDGLPEPLCAIWEPSAAAALAHYQERGGRCPRQFLRTHRVLLLEPQDARALDNINTPEEYRQALDALSGGGGSGGGSGSGGDSSGGSRGGGSGGDRSSKQLNIQYFALLREQAGRSEERLETTAATPADLLAEITSRYGFTLSRDRLKVAVNGEFADWTRLLRTGDAVVFIPPVAGG
jgi:molybdopterin-guanine dinucleotide biosynthesis protein A